ncbi:meiotic recombination protein REC8 homolog [Scyliorhinus canicula]|uniref:meiotic recombination protein REC8 homolog n=1 Tax=Scyliorhinus canicula TaxID=7830 RepID=UPI0018F4771E|nr:meiotic recombination protein REC8 homolog [Scyliorhinus canicula]
MPHDAYLSTGPAPVLTTSPELITLREVEPILMPDVEVERDLPEPTLRELEDFLAEDFRFPEDPGHPERKTPGKRRRREDRREPEEVRGVTAEPPERPEASPVRLPESEYEAVIAPEPPAPPTELPTSQPGEEVPEKELEIPPVPSLPVSPEEEVPKRRPAASPLELTLPEIYDLSPMTPKRRRRRLQFIDSAVQIPREQMQELIEKADVHCQPARPIELPRFQRRPPATLFRNPTYEGWIAPGLYDLWKRCALTEPVDYRARRQEEAAEMELLRETLEPSIGQLTLTGSLEESETETPRSLIKTPEEIGPPIAELEEKLPTVLEVSETLEVSPERALPPMEMGITCDYVLE